MIFILFATVTIGPGSLMLTAPYYGLMTGLMLAPWIGSTAALSAAFMIRSEY